MILVILSVFVAKTILINYGIICYLPDICLHLYPLEFICVLFKILRGKEFAAISHALFNHSPFCNQVDLCEVSDLPNFFKTVLSPK